ncbi:unnamed protein product [Strongylus vulgaris]|uniref:ShKT domain-containing protein n=1 Tax=Strongylus vulgaris TaxID=40348 RepID=A0A3P7I6T7_STRVU|nr:unnamed protein product [Strongylus vulgaris]
MLPSSKNIHEIQCLQVQLCVRITLLLTLCCRISVSSAFVSYRYWLLVRFWYAFLLSEEFRMIVDPVNGMCVDTNMQCPVWASTGQCASSAVVMRRMCALSCGTCALGAEYGGYKNREISSLVVQIVVRICSRNESGIWRLWNDSVSFTTAWKKHL